MPDLKFLRVEVIDDVARIVLNRPKHNVLNLDMMRELNGALEKLQGDNTLKCLVISAEGRSWCAGVEVGDHKPELVGDMIDVFSRMLTLVETFEIPTIAAVKGACLGGGMELAIACDIVIAAEQAVFGQPEIKLGFFPPYAAIRLPQLVGPSKSIEICTTGRRYTAAEAKAIGFITHVTDNDAFDDMLVSILKEISMNSPLIIRLSKQAVKKHLGLTTQAAMAGVNDLFLNTLMKTEDTLEGIRSFEEKRRPEWKNA